MLKSPGFGEFWQRNGVIAKVISPTTFYELASGQRHGAGASLARWLLGLAERPYAAVVRRRNRRFDTGSLPTYRAAVPVISVGNLTVGGSGKTPLVEWIGRRLQSQAVQFAILSRGYGAKAGLPNDEALELALSLPNAPHLQNPDRCKSSRIAVAQYDAKALLLDDGFQHRRLARELDVVLLDASEPFGFERLLPRGALREPIDSLKRADVVVLSRSDMFDPTARAAIQRRVADVAPQAAWCEVVHEPARLISLDGTATPLDSVRGKSVHAFCGIGNPASFRHTLSLLNAQVERFHEFPDHHAYESEDIRRLASNAAQDGVERLLCTRKDLVKWNERFAADASVCAVEIGLKFLQGQAAFESLIDRAVQGQMKSATDRGGAKRVA